MEIIFCGFLFGTMWSSDEHPTFADEAQGFMQLIPLSLKNHMLYVTSDGNTDFANEKHPFLQYMFGFQFLAPAGAHTHSHKGQF